MKIGTLIQFDMQVTYLVVKIWMLRRERQNEDRRFFRQKTVMQRLHYFLDCVRKKIQVNIFPLWRDGSKAYESVNVLHSVSTTHSIQPI